MEFCGCNGQKTLWEKEKKNFNQYFLLFPQCFQKASISGRKKSGLCGEGLKADYRHFFFPKFFKTNLLSGCKT